MTSNRGDSVISQKRRAELFKGCKLISQEPNGKAFGGAVLKLITANSANVLLQNHIEFTLMMDFDSPLVKSFAADVKLSPPGELYDASHHCETGFGRKQLNGRSGSQHFARVSNLQFARDYQGISTHKPAGHARNSFIQY